LYETALYPEAEYTFKHPLTQEVAYRSQLGERRARVHRVVARTLLDLYADKLDEKAAVLAYHWEAAGETLEAARWHRRAARWAGASNPGEALRHWQRVRALLASDRESAEAAALSVGACTEAINLGWRLGLSPAEAAELFAEGQTVAMRNGDLRALA